MNVLTTDGSFWNKYDFFDSDDIQQKSIGGTVMKNLALVGSMFIPYVGPWIAGLSVATQMAGLGATLGKMLVGSDSPTFSAIEGWSQSLNRQTAKTDYAQ
nr:MAG TPA: envelope glycoprotein [Bacteriophage sp.]